MVEFQPGTNYRRFYTQDESDPGIMMETNIASKEVGHSETDVSSPSIYFSPKNKLLGHCQSCPIASRMRRANGTLLPIEDYWQV